MGRVLKTTSGSGGASGGGVSTADVNTLIQANSEYEYINTLEITSNVTGITVSDGIDNQVYEGYKILFTELKPTTQIYYSHRIYNTSGSVLNFIYLSHTHNTSYNYSSGNGASTMYLYGSNSGLSTTSTLHFEIEIMNTGRLANNPIQGYTKSGLAYPAGYWRHSTRGSFICSAESHEFGSLEFNNSVSAGQVNLYGRRIRTQS